MNHEEIELHIQQLSQQIFQDPNQEQLWIERGSLFWKLQDWSHCLADYDQAISRNPKSAAVELKKSVLEIISFYNKDQYNP